MVRRRLALLAAACGGALFACQVLAGIERTDKTAVPTPDVDAAIRPQDAGPPDPCVHTVPPGPPARDDDAGGKLEPIYFAIREMYLGARPDGGAGPPGFDLDNSCTCDTRAFTAHDGGPSCVHKNEVLCDPDGGLDNQVYAALQPYASSVVDVDKAAGLNDQITDGALGLLFYLTDYNGERNDLQVRVGGIISSGVRDGAGCGGDASPWASDPPHYPPQWCGRDRWSVLRSSVLEGTEIPAQLGDGYVTDGQVVYTVDRAQVFFGTVPLQLASVKVSARLSRVGGKWRLDDGVIAGRAETSELLAAAGLLVYDNLGYFCQQSVLFATVKSLLCGGADVTNAPAFDFTDRPCTSISLALSFRAEQASSAPPLADAGLVDPANPCKRPAGDPLYQCP
jgi:hypothetical protein